MPRARAPRLYTPAMAKPAKRKVEGGRVTPKGGPVPKSTPSASTSAGRYTPPVDRTYQMPSPMWVPVLMFTLLALGIVVIILNYVELLPGATTNWYLVLGLAFILGGIITATQYR